MRDRSAFSRLVIVKRRDHGAVGPPGAHPSTTELGQAAELEAVHHLRSLGFRVVDRNVRTARGEIDIVAWDGPTLCFVEVKSRARADYGGARAAVDRAKQTRLWRAAEAYLALQSHRWEELPECRFDVVAMRSLGRDRWDVEVFPNAFEG